MPKIQNTPVITLTSEETREALIEGLRKKFGKKMLPADLKPENVQVHFYGKDADGDTDRMIIDECVVNLPAIETNVSNAPETQGEGS